jgi:hypothetical protein
MLAFRNLATPRLLAISRPLSTSAPTKESQVSSPSYYEVLRANNHLLDAIVRGDYAKYAAMVNLMLHSSF